MQRHGAAATGSHYVTGGLNASPPGTAARRQARQFQNATARRTTPSRRATGAAGPVAALPTTVVPPRSAVELRAGGGCRAADLYGVACRRPGPGPVPRDYGNAQTVTFTGGEAGGSYELRVSSPDGSGIVDAANALLDVTFTSHTQFEIAPRYVSPGDFTDFYLSGKTETRGAVYAVGGTTPVSDILDIDVVYDPSAQFEGAPSWTTSGGHGPAARRWRTPARRSRSPGQRPRPCQGPGT